MAQRYSSAQAFRAALEQRLNQLARDQQLDIARLRRRVAFDRFLARLFATEDTPFILKGGYSLELRLNNIARATKDIDLALPVPGLISSAQDKQMGEIREYLQEAMERSLDDWFVFLIGQPNSDINAAPYGGARILVDVQLAARIFTHFHLDIGLGDAIIAPPEWLVGNDLLNFAGIPPVRVATLPLEQQFAEKIHAYSLPRTEGINSRVKDLIDLALLLHIGLPEASLLAKAVQATFKRRKTHAVPIFLPAPPEEWRAPYQALAASCGVAERTLDDAFAVVGAYWATISQYL